MISLIAVGEYTAILCSSLVLTLLGHLLRFLWLIFDGLTIEPWLRWEGGLPITAYTGRLRQKGYLFQASVKWKVWDIISWSIYKKNKETCCKGTLKGWQMHFMAVKQCIYNSWTRPKFPNKVCRRYTNGEPFLSKMLYERVLVWTSGRSLPV